MKGCRPNVRTEALVPAGMGFRVRGTIGRTPPQASGESAVETRPVTELVAPTGVGGVPTGIRAMGSLPVLRAAK